MTSSLPPLLALALLLAGCASAHARAPAPSRAPVTPSLELPPAAIVPAPGVARSEKSKLRLDASCASCTFSVAPLPAASQPSEAVARLGEACASACKLHPVGPVLRGEQSDRDPAERRSFRVEANHCYRVVVAAGAGVRSVVASLTDSDGAPIDASPTGALPAEGAACFTAADEVSLSIAIGAGKGAWAAQVYSD